MYRHGMCKHDIVLWWPWVGVCFAMTQLIMTPLIIIIMEYLISFSCLDLIGQANSQLCQWESQGDSTCLVAV